MIDGGRNVQVDFRSTSLARDLSTSLEDINITDLESEFRLPSSPFFPNSQHRGRLLSPVLAIVSPCVTQASPLSTWSSLLLRFHLPLYDRNAVRNTVKTTWRRTHARAGNKEHQGESSPRLVFAIASVSSPYPTTTSLPGRGNRWASMRGT